MKKSRNTRVSCLVRVSVHLFIIVYGMYAAHAQQNGGVQETGNDNDKKERRSRARMQIQK